MRTHLKVIQRSNSLPVKESSAGDRITHILLADFNRIGR